MTNWFALLLSPYFPFLYLYFLSYIHSFINMFSVAQCDCDARYLFQFFVGVPKAHPFAFQTTIISNWILKWTIVRLKLNGSLNCVVCTQNTWWSKQIIIFYQQDFLANSELRHYQSRFRLTYLKIVSIFIRHQNIFDSGTELQRGLKLIEKRWTSFLCYGVKLLVLNTLNLNHKEFRFERTPHPGRGSLNVQ